MTTLTALLDVLDARQVTPDRYVGTSEPSGREMVDASEVLGQTIVAASASFPAKTVRRASGVFSRPVRVAEPIELRLDTVNDGRAFTTVVVSVVQGERRCAAVTVLLDVPTDDVIRHPTVAPDSAPDEAIPYAMPLEGREVRLVGLTDPNDADEVGPPRIEAWLRYATVPERPELRKALIAQFTGHLSISTAMRPHPGFGTVQSHRTLSTAVIALEVTFHEPVDWNGWIRYDHHSTAVGAGMAYARGQVCDEAGRLIASFSQDAMIRTIEQSSPGATLAEAARL